MSFERLTRKTSKRLRAPRAAPVEASLDAAIAAMQEELANQLESLRALETKATLIVPSFGIVVAALAGHRVAEHLSGMSTAVGIVAVGSATASVAYALRCLLSASYSVGPDPVILARSTASAPAALKQGILDSLAIATESVRVLIIAKGAYLNRSLIAAGVTIAAVGAFLGTGGLS